MYTNSKGISYYKRGKSYYRNTGWLEVEITKEEYDKEIESMKKSMEKKQIETDEEAVGGEFEEC